MRVIHVVDINLLPICGEDAPTHWAATALTLAAAESMRRGHDVVCTFCEAAYLGTDVQGEARKGAK